MTATWGPGFDAEIGYRMERARTDFGRHNRGRVLSDARDPRTWRRSKRGSVASG